MAMFKIERVIHNCADCIWSKQFVEENGNTQFILICNWFENQNSEDIEDRAFIVSKSNRKLKNHANVEIPENCPLQDYKTINT